MTISFSRRTELHRVSRDLSDVGHLYLKQSLQGGRTIWQEADKKLRNEELHSLYSSPSINRMIKSRRMRRAGHVPLMAKKSDACRILLGKARRKGTTMKALR
jgi:hypothetical protein